MAKICDNKSAGVVVRAGRKLLMIDRGNYPQCKAFPAGHCDGETFLAASVKELQEEVGLENSQHNFRNFRKLWDGRIGNPCKREGGTHHDWMIFSMDLVDPVPVKAGDDAKKAFWAEEEEWRHWAVRTELFFSTVGLPWTEVGILTVMIFGEPKLGPISPIQKSLYADWQRDPGIEPVWYYMLRQAGMCNWPFQSAPVGQS